MNLDYVDTQICIFQSYLYVAANILSTKFSMYRTVEVSIRSSEKAKTCQL